MWWMAVLSQRQASVFARRVISLASWMREICIFNFWVSWDMIWSFPNIMSDQKANILSSESLVCVIDRSDIKRSTTTRHDTNRCAYKRIRINICITCIRRAFVRPAPLHCPPDVLRSHAISQPLHSLQALTPWYLLQGELGRLLLGKGSRAIVLT